MSQLGAAREWAAAVALLRRVTQPNQNCFNSAISACGRSARWEAALALLAHEDVALGVRHTVVLYRNQSAKVSGRYLSDAAFGDADRIAASPQQPWHACSH